MTKAEHQIFKQWKTNWSQGTKTIEKIHELANEYKVDPGTMMWILIHYVIASDYDICDYMDGFKEINP